MRVTFDPDEHVGSISVKRIVEQKADTALEATARQLFDDFNAKRFETAGKSFDANMQKQLTPGRLAELRFGVEQRYGTFQSVTKVAQRREKAYQVIDLTTVYDRSPATFSVYFDGAGGSPVCTSNRPRRNLDHWRSSPVGRTFLSVHEPKSRRTGMKSRWSIARMMLICLVIVPGALLYASEKSGKPSVGVAEFTNETSAGWWYGGVGNDLAGMLTNELASTEKFRMVERAKLSHVLTEQDLGASGRVSEHTAAKVGKLTGAKYLVMGTVSAYEEHSSGGGGGLSFHGIGVGGKKEDAYIAIDLRVVDTTTGEVEYTRTVEAKLRRTTAWA